MGARARRTSLNEVQLLRELQHETAGNLDGNRRASMKCSS